MYPSTVRSLPVGVCVRVGKYPIATTGVKAVDALVESGFDLQCDAVADFREWALARALTVHQEELPTEAKEAKQKDFEL